MKLIVFHTFHNSDTEEYATIPFHICSTQDSIVVIQINTIAQERKMSEGFLIKAVFSIIVLAFGVALLICDRKSKVDSDENDQLNSGKNTDDLNI